MTAGPRSIRSIRPQLTRREWRAINEALAFRLAGECDEDVDTGALATAQRKVWARLNPLERGTR